MLKPIVIGAEEFFISGDDIVESTKLAQLHWKQITSRLRNPFKQDKNDSDVLLDDAYLRVRVNDDKEYYEWHSRKVGGYKRMSLGTDKKAELRYFIAFMAPWVRWNRDEEREEVLYTAMQLENSENGNRELQELGYTESDACHWIPAKRVKRKTNAVNEDHWVWEPLD